MIVADTSVWIEFLKSRPLYFSSLGVLLDQQQVVAVECVFGELLQGVKSSRERGIIEGYWTNLPKRSESGLWVKAGTLSATHSWPSKGIGLIDAFLLCFVQTYHFQLWTLDKKLAAVAEPSELFHLPDA
ncbi:MAG: PIN domain-containing protein [Nitrospira sp.]|nr:PIN domain-containing protein [Nitrospira sp.]MCW5784691.1 PIN domain-containing protein [Nitrospirales bacterium]